MGCDGPLFRAHDGPGISGVRRRLSTRAVSYLVAQGVARAGVKGKRISPHACRHTFAIRCLRTGGSIVAIAKLLGHSSIATTQLYVNHLALSELRDAVPPLPMDTPRV